jgi:hypothetical protein
VHEHDRASPVQLAEVRRDEWVTEIAAAGVRHDHRAGGTEFVERASSFRDGVVDGRERDRGEELPCEVRATQSPCRQTPG